MLTTVVLSVLVVLVLGNFLLARVTSGLLTAKVDAALVEASSGTTDAQAQFDATDRTDPRSLAQLVDDVVRRLSTGSGPAGLHEILLLRSPRVPASVVLAGRASYDVEEQSIPAALRASVVAAPRQAWTYVDLRYTSGRAVPGLAVGSTVTIPGAGLYELYYLFPLTQEQSTVALVQRTLLGAGVVLVLVLAGIAAMVTRLVVRPVRQAAETAGRLAAGRLQERLPVRGEDDLARLAQAFNAMAANLARQIRALEDLSRVQRRFVSDVSHELRTPLTTVRMAADVLYESRVAFDPASTRSAELLQTQLDRFESLLSDLLEVSRFDAGAAVLDPEQVDLRDLVRRVLDAAAPLAERRGSTVGTALPDSPAVVEADPRRLDRVLRNLVVNAIEHGEGRPILVTVAVSEQAVAVAVRDHGVGLRPGEAALVFNRFWRGDPARARTTGGTGLGLSIALEDARLHGGWLQAWGYPGDGAQFRLTLPRVAGEPLLRSPLPLEPPDSCQARLRAIGAPYRRTAPEATGVSVRLSTGAPAVVPEPGPTGSRHSAETFVTGRAPGAPGVPAETDGG